VGCPGTSFAQRQEIAGIQFDAGAVILALRLSCAGLSGVMLSRIAGEGSLWQGSSAVLHMGYVDGRRSLLLEKE